MNSYKLTHKTDCVISKGDVVQYPPCGYCLCVHVKNSSVYLLRLDSDMIPFGVVFTVPVSTVRSFEVGQIVGFRVNGKYVEGHIKSFDVFGNAVVKLHPDFLPGNPIRVYHVAMHSFVNSNT